MMRRLCCGSWTPGHRRRRHYVDGFATLDTSDRQRRIARYEEAVGTGTFLPTVDSRPLGRAAPATNSHENPCRVVHLEAGASDRSARFSLVDRGGSMPRNVTTTRRYEIARSP